MMQVMTNLLSNAIKFNRRNGSISVSILKNEKNELQFSLKDEGEGIASNELDAVFNAFIQSNKIRRNSGGTELGLAISREIITGHNRRIWAKNNTDNGTTFTFVIPSKNKKKGEKMTNSSHILIVDDEPLNIEIISELLESEGNYQISTAEDGDVALKMMEAIPEEFDIVLLDRMMPKMNGMDVLLKMKQHEVLKHCPVIFQTAKNSIKDITEGLEAGAHYYLAKPFEGQVLLSVVKTAAQDRQRYKSILDELNTNKVLMGLLKIASFEFKDIDEARSLAALLCNACPEPQKVVMGLTELMVNAIEHGNLGITYDEKSELNEQGTWIDEVDKRLALPEYSERRASIDFQLKCNVIKITVKDQGDGFDWKKYMDFDPSRAMDNHGRGIAIANKLSFSSVEYNGNGNEVCAKIKI